MIFDVKKIHIGITSLCNLECPHCSRTLHKDKTEITSLSLDQLKNILDLEKNTFIERITLSGNSGDPAACPDLHNILKYFKNNNINMLIETNGSLQNERWWKKTAEILDKDDLVRFSIDGLIDTNHLYRINEDYTKIMKNALSFITDGGNASWKYILFEHNQHQVEEAKYLAKQMGFNNFELVTPRRKENVFFNKEIQEKKEVSCKAIDTNTLYLNEQGHFHTCCWIEGNTAYDESQRKEMERYKTDYTNINEYLKSDYWKAVVKSWNTEHCWNICEKKCATMDRTRKIYYTL